MKKASLYLLICFAGLLSAASTPSVFAQSQALNGQIESTVLDQTSAAVWQTKVFTLNKEVRKL